MLKHYLNPLFPIEERLETCDGEVQFWKECYEHQRDQREKLEERVKELQTSLELIKLAVEAMKPPRLKKAASWFSELKR